MKIRYKLTAVMFVLILLTAVANYKLLTATVEELLTKRLESAEALLGQGMATALYRLVIEEKQEEVTAYLFNEKNLRNQKISYILVKDKQGDLFAHTFLSKVPDEIISFEKSFSDNVDYRIDKLPDSELGVYDIAVPIREGILQVGTIHIGINKQFITNTTIPLKQASEKILLFAIVFIFAGAAIAYAISLAITKSISQLTKAAQKISRGEFDTEFEIKSRDEIGELADSFSIMRQSVKQAKDELEEQNEKLEELVRERTQKLEKSNEELILNQEQLETANQNLAEQRKNLKIVFSAMDYPLYVVNDDYTIAMMNDRAQDLVTPDTPSPPTCHALSHHSSSPCTEEDYSCPLKIVFEKKQPVTMEHTHYNKNGEEIFVEVRAYPIYDEAGEVVQMVEACIDITEKKKAEEERLRLERELNKSHKLESIGTLAAGVAHEINTPIQFIGDNTQFAKDSLDDVFGMVAAFKDLLRNTSEKNEDHISKAIKEIEDDGDYEYLREELPKSLEQTIGGVEHVSAIVKAMKDFSYIGSDENMQHEDLNHAIETTLTISKNEWKYIAEIDRQLDESLPSVPCYIGEIKQVLLNLIVNAAHAISDKQQGKSDTSELGLITISTSQDNGKVKVAIADNGVGVAEENKGKLFDHFFTTKEVSKGTGQGLTVAYQIITEKHGGEIWFESVVGKGTTFFFTLDVDLHNK